jgi:tetratricopeptide (TPR) repeat protein
VARRQKKFRFPFRPSTVSRWFKSTRDYYIRRWSKSWGNARRALREFFAVREGEHTVGGEDSRNLPTLMSCLNPFFCIGQLFGFLLRFAQTRSPRIMLAGIPAFLGMCIPIAGELWWFPDRQELISQEQLNLRSLLEREDYQGAQFVSRRLLYLTEYEPNAVVDHLDVLVAAERVEEAYDLAYRQQTAKPLLWVIRREILSLSNEKGDRTAKLTTMQRSLQYVLDIAPGNAEAQYLLGQLYVMQGNFTGAFGCFDVLKDDPLFGRRPTTWYALAVIAGFREETDRMQRFASVAADLEVKQIQTVIGTQQFSLPQFAKYIDYLTLAGREEEAERQVIEAERLHPEFLEQLKPLRLMSQVLMCRRLRLLPNRSVRDLTEALNALTRAMQIDVNNLRVTAELMDFCVNESLPDDVVAEQLKLARDLGVSPGMVHLIQGTRFMRQSPPQTEAAIVSFKLAQEHIPGLPVVMNNLADALAEQENGDLTLALGLITEALRLMPNKEHLYDTRGKIFLRQGKTTEAIADFERALSEPTIRVEVYKNLADAWRTAGNAAEASRFQTLRERLLKATVESVEPVESIPPE